MAHLAEWNDGERVFRLYKRGAQPWEPWGGGHPEYDTYAYVVTDKHDNLIIPGRGVSMDYYHTPDDAMRGQGRVMRLHKQWDEAGESRAMPTLDPAAILASYRAVCERTEHGGGAEDFATVAAWIPALVGELAKRESERDRLHNAGGFLYGTVMALRAQLLCGHPTLSDETMRHAQIGWEKAINALPPPQESTDAPA